MTPALIQVHLPCPESTIALAESELRNKAEQDPNKCWGYFPDLGSKDGIDSALPDSQAYAFEASRLAANARVLTFNFLRLSLIEQQSAFPFHLDSDATTALTGERPHTGKAVWRLLINVSDRHSRNLSYLDVNPDSLELETRRGYTHYPHTLGDLAVTTIAIPPREGSEASGVLFCASRVLHTGRDDEKGHFVAGYGCEELTPQAASALGR